MENNITFLRDYIIEQLTRFYTFEDVIPIKILVSCMLGVVLGFAMWAVYAGIKRFLRLCSRLLRGIKMNSKREKKEQLRKLLADIYTDALEDAVFKGKITDEDARREYVKLSRTIGLWDVANGRYCGNPPKPEDLKEKIRTRLAQYKKTVASNPVATQQVDDIETQLMAVFAK